MAARLSDLGCRFDGEPPVFFFNDTATTEIYTLSLHDALPIYGERWDRGGPDPRASGGAQAAARFRDRKSTRLNSSHSQISYAVFCLKKKMKEECSSNPSEQAPANTARHLSSSTPLRSTTPIRC